MIKENMKDGNIMNNQSGENIVYLNHRTSNLAAPNTFSSSAPNSLINILRDRTIYLDNQKRRK